LLIEIRLGIIIVNRDKIRNNDLLTILIRWGIINGNSNLMGNN